MKLSLEGRKRDLALFMTGALLAGLLMTPAGAHVGQEISHLWNNHLRARVAGLTYTKARANTRFARKNAERWRDVGAPGQPVFTPDGCQEVSTSTTSPATPESGYSPVSFFKDLSGVVHLRGTVRCSGAYGENRFTSGSSIFTLPPAYRPAYPLYIVTVDCARRVMWVSINSNGKVRPELNDTYSCANLNGLTFRPG